MRSTKVCKGCGVTRVLEDYHKNAGYKDGRRATCKECLCAKARKRYHDDPDSKEKARERSQGFRDNNPEYSKDWNTNNSDSRKATYKKYRDNNLELCNQRQQVWIDKKRAEPVIEVLEGTKSCNSCGVEKELSEYHRNTLGKDGTRNDCRECLNVKDCTAYWSDPEKSRAKTRLSYQNNKDVINAKQKLVYDQNPEKYRAIGRRYYRLNKETCKARSSLYRKNNPGLFAAHASKRRAAKIQRTPKWLTQDQLDKMKHTYETRPKGYHVDHIAPLRGVHVSGLHVPWNLQHLLAAENIAKGNR